ncbi:hypothetical protein DPMN_185410 [Dreissena polymorpha]|uniref:Uncharacterized protein n=1 Tax=Dreissena polymorpha TaxID=45954 RepID=A0A9D4DNJ1_DREPO|nr:hypothetical protein DPMN_185410 [Dreissena polymorpha]
MYLIPNANEVPETIIRTVDVSSFPSTSDARAVTLIAEAYASCPLDGEILTLIRPLTSIEKYSLSRNDCSKLYVTTPYLPISSSVAVTAPTTAPGLA